MGTNCRRRASARRSLCADIQGRQEPAAADGRRYFNATETEAGNPTLSLNIALHAGKVTYGNVGTADRLDFTVIGPAVNEAARLEGLCKEGFGSVAEARRIISFSSIDRDLLNPSPSIALHSQQ